METDDNFEGEYIDRLAIRLSSELAVQIVPGTQWWRHVSKMAGVYAIYENAALIYCGETACLRDRMRDLGDTRHHTLRRSVGHKRLADFSGFCKATSKKKFPELLEVEVDKHMANFAVRALPVPLGRKELEDKMIEVYSPVFNKKPRRGI